LGNLFGSATETFLLYTCIPALSVALVIAALASRVAFARRRALHGNTWPAEVLLERAAQYRAPAAALQHRIPRRLRWLARWAFLWGSGIAAFSTLVGISLIALVGMSAWLIVPLTVLGVGGVSCAHLVRASLSLTENDRSALPHIERARVSLAVHHTTVLLLATGVLVLFVLSNRFFWNGMQAHRASQLVEIVTLYAVFVLAPCGAGFVLARQLGAARDLYRDAV
jgi:hypothetical protein